MRRPLDIFGPPPWIKRANEAAEKRRLAREARDRPQPLPGPVVGYVAPAVGPVVEIEAEPEAGEESPLSEPQPEGKGSFPSARPVQPPGGGQRGQAPAVHTSRMYAVLSDLHCPYHDVRAVGAVCDALADLRPHGLILNGDFLDLYELSRFNAGSLAKLEGRRTLTTFLVANEVLDDLRAAAGDRLDEWHYTAGNHELRAQRWLEQGDHGVLAGEDVLTIPSRLRCEERGIVYHDGYPTARVRLGHLTVTHGKRACAYTAAANWRDYGSSVLTGHSHTPEIYYGAGLDSQRAAYVSGHLADPDSVAMQYAPRPNRWAQGWALVYLRRSGAFTVELINLWDGKFGVGGREFG